MTGDEIPILVGDYGTPVYLRENDRARRVSLRVDAPGQKVVLVKPKRMSRTTAIAFATERAEWIAERVSEFAPPVPFEPGARVPFRDIEHVIVHAPEAKRGVWAEAGRIHVSGQAEFVSRRVRDWFKERAREAIVPLANSYALEIEKRVARVSIRDQRSRWGSCTSDAVLSFSWRLIMAPDTVMRYVVAHEVAHLRELNHLKRFWHIVDKLVTTREESTAWLSSHGMTLHCYGQDRVIRTR
jgi:predicted metal-dependent hydrolase